jgi:hypothetical protein
MARVLNNPPDAQYYKFSSPYHSHTSVFYTNGERQHEGLTVLLQNGRFAMMTPTTFDSVAQQSAGIG